MTSPRNLLWIVPLLLAVSYPAWRQPAIHFLSPDTEPVASGQSAELTAGRSAGMEGIFLSQNRADREEWHLRAERLSMENDENDLRLEKIEAVIFGSGKEEKGQRRTTVISPAGHYEGAAQLLTLSGGVRVETAEGYTMRAKQLSFDGSRDLISASDGVRIMADGIEARGRSLAYNTDTGTFKLLGKVNFQSR